LSLPPRPLPQRGYYTTVELKGTEKMLATFAFMEWFFLVLLVGLTAASGLVAVYVVARLIKNPAR
jgi:hypothetical protein